jgi:CRISPR/Cas system-associated endonuclease Cas1
MLSWRVHRALIRAKLEPFLGFLHTIKFERPSLVCDFVELYRFLVEDFLIHQSQKYSMKDFTFKIEARGKRLAKRQYLNNAKTRELMTKINVLSEKKVEIPRIYLGKKQTVETLINEEALLFARFLRNQSREWKPRIVHI